MNMKNLTTQEPSALIGTITGLVAAVLTALVAFGVDLDEGQRDALLGLTAVLAPIVAGMLIRGNVYAPDTHDRDVDAAYRAGKNVAGQRTGTAADRAGEGVSR